MDETQLPRTCSPDPFFAVFDRGGEMGCLTRSFDWSQTALGPIEIWPQSLRTAVGIMLASSQPKVILWGGDGLMLYNDAYAEIAGRRHPRILGTKVLEAWPEIAEFNAKVIEIGLAGGTLAYRDQHLVIQRNGLAEDIWLDLEYCPILDESGTPGGVLAIVMDTTERARTEDRLRVAQEAGGVGTFEWFPETGLLTASDEYRRIWGLAPGMELTDEMLATLLHPDDRHIAMASRLDWANPLEYAEFRIRRANDGRERWVCRRGEVVATPVGGTRRFVGVVIDITDIKEATEAVRRSERRLRELFEQMHEGFFVGEAIHDDSGVMCDFRLIEVNNAFQTLTGISPSDAIGRSARETMPDFPETGLQAYSRVLETREPMQFEMFVPKLGDRWYEVRSYALSASRFAVLFVEITERKAIETALQESEARFRTFAQSMPNHIWAADPDGNLDWFNEQAYRYTGKAEGDLSGVGWGKIVHADDFGQAVERWQASLALGTRYEVKYRLRRADGIYRWHLCRALPIRDRDGNISRWIGNNTDIEDQIVTAETMARLADTLEERVAERTRELAVAHEALRQSQKMETIGQLTGGIAHDFNNLLQGIIGSLDLVQARYRQGRIQELDRFLAGAISSANRAAALTHRLLAFSRRQPLDPKPVKTNALVVSMEDLLRRTLGEQIELSLVLEDALWLILCDPNQLESAILNLVINARDAMPGGGNLSIETSNVAFGETDPDRPRELQSGQYACIAVRDSGSGMTPEVIARAFDPFFTTKPIGQGTGLGLSMIYGFARQSDGHVEIRSKPAEGTTVRLYLPRYQGETAEDESRAVTVAPAVTEGEVVLVIEDEAIVRALVVEVLRDMGYHVLEAADSATALDILQSARRIDLLVADIGLPGLNGRQVADGARATRPDLKVLFMTGYAANAALAGGFLEPEMAMITKPFSMEALASRVRQMIEQP